MYVSCANLPLSDVLVGVTHVIEHTLTPAEVSSGIIVHTGTVNYDTSACGGQMSKRGGEGQCAVVGFPNDQITIGT